MDWLRVELSHDALDVGGASTWVTLPSTGATSLFVGTTRDNFEGKKVVRLEYEAFDSMAVKELTKLCVEAKDRWDVSRVAILHRLGEVPVLEASVVVAVSSPHRRASLEAVTFLIDTLKVRVPIWKKEWYEDESGVWKENTEATRCCGGGHSHGAPPAST